jgi:hypothetical protein
MKLKFIIGAILLSNSLLAQHDLTLIVKTPMGTDKVFVSGNFNGPRANDPIYQLIQRKDRFFEVTIHDLLPGDYYFKFSRGEWAKAEANDVALDIETRKIIFKKDTTVYLSIEGWRDDYVVLNDKPDSVQFSVALDRGAYYINRNLDSCYKYAMFAEQLATKFNSKHTTVQSLGLTGELYGKLGHPEEAVKYCLKEIDLRKQLKDSDGVANCFINMGFIYGESDEEKSMEYFRNALKWGHVEPYNPNKKTNTFLNVSFTALGRYHFRRNQFDSARYYAQKSIEIEGGLHDSGPVMLLGDIYKTMGKNREALTNYLAVAIGGHNDDNNLNSEATASNAAARLYYQEGKLDSAFWFARRAYTYSVTTKSPYGIAYHGAYLASLFKLQNQSDSAYFYLEAAMKAKDSAYSKEKERQLQASYFNEKLRQQELIVQDDKLRSQRKFYILIGIVIILLLAALQYRSRLTTNFYRKTAEMEMKALRAQMNPHFIFNCLTSINRYIVKSDHKTASNYLTKFSKLIRLILDNSAAEHIDFDTELQTLKLYIEMELLRFDHTFEYNISIDEMIASENIQFPPMLVQPYVENAIWHGLLHKDDNKKLWLRFRKNDNNTITVEVEDNGVGRQKAKELEGSNNFKSRSYGMQISKDRVDIINRLYKYKTSVAVHDLKDEHGASTGTKVVLQIPLIKIAFNNA